MENLSIDIIINIINNINTKKKTNFCKINKYYYLSLTEIVCKYACEKLNISGPKKNAKKYKTWQSILSQKKKLCINCYDKYQTTDELCESCYQDIRDTYSENDIIEMRITEDEYINQTTALKSYYLDKNDIVELNYKIIPTRYYEIYMYNQDDIIKICMNKYGGISGFKFHLNYLEKCKNKRCANRKIKEEREKEKHKKLTIIFDELINDCPNIEKYRYKFIEGIIKLDELKNIIKRIKILYNSLFINNLSKYKNNYESNKYIEGFYDNIDELILILNRKNLFKKITNKLNICIKDLEKKFINSEINIFDISLIEIRYIGIKKNLENKGLKLREDSVLCNNYIYNNINNRENLDVIINKMDEISWYYNKTNYSNIMKNYYNNSYNNYGYNYYNNYEHHEYHEYHNYDSSSDEEDNQLYKIQRSNEVKEIALEQWIEENDIYSKILVNNIFLNNLGLPKYVENKIYGKYIQISEKLEKENNEISKWIGDNKDIYNLIINYSKYDNPNMESLCIPDKLKNNDRKIIHNIAKKINLNSQSVSINFKIDKNPIPRSQKCYSCHIENKGKKVPNKHKKLVKYGLAHCNKCLNKLDTTPYNRILMLNKCIF